MWRSYCREHFCEMRCLFALQKFSCRYPRCSLSRRNSVWGSPLKFLKSSLLLQWLSLLPGWLYRYPKFFWLPDQILKSRALQANTETVVTWLLVNPSSALGAVTPRPFVLQHFALGVATSLTFHSMLLGHLCSSFSSPVRPVLSTFLTTFSDPLPGFGLSPALTMHSSSPGT